jgi:hypothetical protein
MLDENYKLRLVTMLVIAKLQTTFQAHILQLTITRRYSVKNVVK